MTDYMNALLICLQPVNFLLIIAMVSLGIVFGAIPGLSATLGILYCFLLHLAFLRKLLLYYFLPFGSAEYRELLFRRF